MNQGKVTAVFDIGKTNKKFFLFDEEFQELHREYIRIDEIADEDGYPTEDLESLKNWMKKVFNDILETEKFDISAINFSTYGASLVHLDENNEVLTPLYNYTKDIDASVIDSFYEKYGPEEDFEQITGSPKSGMLNSGMQIYWLKQTQPEVFKKIKYSLHLPQYLSYIFTGIPISEYTSIGCHTALWDYKKRDYHRWVYEENIHLILPPIVSTETSFNMNYNGKRIKIGVGIHDSSAALLPYVRSIKENFILVSTGTWSISFNPFSDSKLSKKEVEKGCINYMRINGKAVKASRIFLGNEFKKQIEFLSYLYNVPRDFHKKIEFDYDIYYEITKDFEPKFHWYSLKTENMPSETIINYYNVEQAYHHLMIELVKIQAESIKTIEGSSMNYKLFVDGGFTDNNVYIQLLSHYLRNMSLRTTKASLGSALGAALSISDKKLNSKFLKKNYSLKKHVPFIIK